MCVNNLPKVATQWNSGATRDSNRGLRVLIQSALTTTPASHTRPFQDPLPSNSKTFKAPFCSQGLSRFWKNGNFSRTCGHPANWTINLHSELYCTCRMPPSIDTRPTNQSIITGTHVDVSARQLLYNRSISRQNND